MTLIKHIYKHILSNSYEKKKEKEIKHNIKSAEVQKWAV